MLMDGAERIHAVMGEQGVLGGMAISVAGREGVDADTDAREVSVAVSLRKVALEFLPLPSRSPRLGLTEHTVSPDCEMVIEDEIILATNASLAADTGLSAAASSASPTGLRCVILLGEVRGMGSLAGVLWSVTVLGVEGQRGSSDDVWRGVSSRSPEPSSASRA
jgi:hypothetical protein